MTKVKPVVREILSNEKYWEISGVNYFGKIHNYKLFEKLIPSMNSEQLSEFYEREKTKRNPFPANSILTFSLMKSAVESENISLINYFHKTFNLHFIKTLSKVIYMPLGEAEIIHNHGTSDEFKFSENIVDEDYWIKDLDLKQRKTLELILDEKNIQNLDKIFNKINGTSIFLWGVNRKPLKK